MDSFQYDDKTNRPVGLRYMVNATSNAFQVNTALTWNANGSLQQMGYTDTNDSSKNQTCTYSADDLGRIASVSCGANTWAQNFTYDAMGNITKSGSSSYSAGYSESTNQVNSGLPQIPAYDANGNQRSSTGLSSISWNANGQPSSVTPLNGGPITGTFDALGRLVENASGSAYTQFVFSPSGQKIASVQAGTLVKGTVPLPGGATAIYSGTTGMPTIRHLDWLGSARLSTTWAHTVQSKVAYAPFGETYNEAGASANDHSFTGQEQDTVSGSAATGIYDFLFRKYDPAAGRWLSPDPGGWNSISPTSPQSLDRYAYVQNNPLKAVDPNALACVFLDSSGTVSVDNFGGDSMYASGCQADGGNYIGGYVDEDSVRSAFGPGGSFDYGDGTAIFQYGQNQLFTNGQFYPGLLQSPDSWVLGIAGGLNVDLGISQEGGSAFSFQTATGYLIHANSNNEFTGQMFTTNGGVLQPHSDGTNVVDGAYAGLGLQISFGNDAGSIHNLEGGGRSISTNIGVGWPVDIGITFTTGSNGAWLVTVTPPWASIGGGISHTETNNYTSFWY